MRKNFSFQTIAAATLATCLLFAACQEQELNPLQEDEVLTAQATQARAASAGDDKAFDRESEKVMHDWQTKMNAAMKKMTCEPDVSFAKMMIMHHQLGVDMANVALKYEHHEKAIKLTKQSRDANLKSKKRLEDALKNHKTNRMLPADQCRGFMEEMKREMHVMQEAMSRAAHQNDRNDVDLDFSELIVQHHQGAIKMSAVELEYGHDGSIRKEADMLIDEQAKEIEDFSKFKNDHLYGRL